MGAPNARRRRGAIDAACREIGFFAITGHGVSDRVVDDLRRAAHEFFALPLVENSPRGIQSTAPTAATNHPNYDALIECLARPGEAKHPPVRSGAYRDLKYAKIGLAGAGAPAPGAR